MKVATRVIWWASLGTLILGTIVAWHFESRFSQLQSELLFKIGDDITSNQKKWSNATLDQREPFFWWKDLDLGHRLIMEIADLKQFVLVGIALQLAFTLASTRRKLQSLKAQQS